MSRMAVPSHFVRVQSPNPPFLKNNFFDIFLKLFIVIKKLYMGKLTDNLLVNIRETLLDFRSLLPRYMEVKNNKELLNKFCSRNRNPLFDISTSKYFYSGLSSNDAKNSPNFCFDHYIQRTKAVDLIFKELERDPDMEVERFIKLLKKYCSTVKITKEEHSRVSSYCKNNKDAYNYEAYLACNIFVPGLSELMLS